MRKLINMENLAYLPKPKRSDRKVTIWPDGSFTSGRSQPQRKDKLYNPLQGISSHKTFYGATKVSYKNQHLDKDTDPATLERIAIAYQDAGNIDMAERFADAYATKILSGEYIAILDRHCDRFGDDWGSNGDQSPTHSGQNFDRRDDNLGDKSDPSMGLSDVVISHKSPCTKEKYIKISDLDGKSSKQRRGSGGITCIAKRKTRSGVHIMQEKYSISCLAFGTLTFPALRPDELELVNTHMPDLTRKFFQELARELARCGLDTDYVYVIEIQEKRYRNWGQFCQHVHFVIQSRKDRFSQPAIHYSFVRRVWEAQLSNLLGYKVDCPAATQLDKMKRRKVGEMGKYMTKGSQIAKEAIAKGDGHMLPTAWSGMSNNLKKEVKASIKTLTGQDADDFDENIKIMRDLGLLSYVPIVWTPPDTNRQITIGFAGWVKDWDKVCQFLSGCYENFVAA